MRALSNLIQFKSRSIGSDRISKVLSFALILSLFQLISAVEAPISNAVYSVGSFTNTQKADATGGGGPAAADCSSTKSNSVLYKISARNDSYDSPNTLTKLLGWCGQLNSDGLSALDRSSSTYTGSIPTTGGYGLNAGNADVYDSCGNDVIVGFTAYKSASGFVSGIKLKCGKYPAGGNSYFLGGVIGVSTATSETKSCSTGTVAIGLAVNYGGILDQFGIRCGFISGASQSIAIASTGTTSKIYPYSQALSITTSGSNGSGSVSYAIVSGGSASGCALSNSTNTATISATSSGTCLVAATIAADSNYASATSGNATFTFSKASLTVTASSPIVNLGDPVPTITPIYSGFVNSENSSSSAFTTGLTAPTCTTSYTTASTVDTSPATICSGGSSTGYSFSYVSGRVLILSGNDSAISLNGTSQYSSVSGAQVIPTSTSSTFSAEAWIRQPASRSSGTLYQILSQGTTYNQFYLKVLNGSVIFSRSGFAAENTCAVGIPTEEWTHVAVVVGTTSQSCYINGSLAGSFSQSSTIALGTSFAVGQYAPGGGEYFLGQIDEVKIWDRARTQSEIQSDLKSYGGTLADGLVAYYDFNELVGSRIYNRSNGGSSAFDLTNTGAPTIARVETTTVVQAYTVVTFPRTYLTANGGWRVPNGVAKADLLVVGGGGGGSGGNTNPGVCESGGGGGGGGGQVRTLLGQNISANTFLALQVGAGGPGGLGGVAGSVFGKAGNSGGSSVVSSVTSLGGGGGGTTTTSCRPSAGGTSGSGSKAGGAAAAVNGAGGGGGGGDSVAGSAGTGTYGNYSGGAGGAGSSSSITGLTYGGGGGGSHNAYWASLNGGGQAGSGGSGGGGSGGTSNITGTPNTGGGGGGGQGAGCCAASRGGDGASGVVVLRYITDTPTILVQPLSDTTTAGIVETFTVRTSTAPAPLTKTVQWQFTADTTTGTTGWTNVTSGTGGTTDTFTTVALTTSMNKYRFRAIVTFSDTSALSVQETSTVAILTINPAITITSDTSTITRKYGDTQTVRTITYLGGTTESGTVGTSTSHTARGAFGTLATGKIVLDTSTSTVVFRVDTGTVVGTYVETITVTDFKGATTTYTQRVVVNPADTLTVQADTLTAITYGNSLFPTYTASGFVNGDSIASITYGHVSCANGGMCAIGDIGPGGGVVFYVSQNNSDSQTAISGYTSGGIYLEAAPVGWAAGISVGAGETAGTTYLDPVVNWCNTAFDFNSKGTGIGQGADNSKKMDANCSSGAGQIAVDLVLNGKNDWYLPSQDELTQMGVQKNLIGLLYGVNNCYGSTCYWSSTQNGGGSSVRGLQVSVGSETMGNNDTLLTASNKVMVRPIRAFSPITDNTETVTAGTPNAAGTYLLRPTAITLTNNVDTSNYVSVVYRSSQSLISRANQTPKISMQPAKATYDTGTATQVLTHAGGTASGAVFYLIAAGSAAGCSISGSTLSITSAGVCNVMAFKQASANYFYDSATAIAVTFSKFVSSQPVQVQLYPSMIPLNGANSLETATLTVPVITSIIFTDRMRVFVDGAFRIIEPFYTINGSGFTGANRIIKNFTDVTPFTVKDDNSITVPEDFGASAGLVFIECSDGRLGPTPFYNFVP